MPTEESAEPVYSDSGTKIINVVPRNVRDGKVKLPSDFKHHSKSGKKLWIVFVGIAVLIILWLLFQTKNYTLCSIKMLHLLMLLDMQMMFFIKQFKVLVKLFLLMA